MKRTILSFLIIICSFYLSYGNNKLDSLSGRWKVFSYQSIYNDSLINNWTNNYCTLSITLDIRKNGSVKFIISSENNDSIIYNGKLKIGKNRIVNLKTNIDGKVHVGHVEPCFTYGIRLEIKHIFESIITFKHINNMLVMYYNSTEINNEEINKIILIKQE